MKKPKLSISFQLHTKGLRLPDVGRNSPRRSPDQGPPHLLFSSPSLIIQPHFVGSLSLNGMLGDRLQLLHLDGAHYVHIYIFILWSAMQQVTACQEFPQGNFLSWENNNWFLNSTKVNNCICVCIVIVSICICVCIVLVCMLDALCTS